MSSRFTHLFASALLLGCSHGGADDRHSTKDTGSCPGCPPGGSATPINPNPNPGTDPYAGGCSGISSIAVDNREVCAVLTSFGSPLDDSNFYREVNTQQPWWSNVAPVSRVWQYRECGGGNAFAARATSEIAFGSTLYHNLIASYGLPAVQIVLAHEFGHVVQYKLGYFEPKVPTRTTELEADLFAGFYMGWTRDPGIETLKIILDTIHSVGDENYTSPGHHGTPPERKFMALWGYSTAKAALSQGTTPSWDELHAIARREIGTMNAIASFYDQ